MHELADGAAHRQHRAQPDLFWVGKFRTSIAITFHEGEPNMLHRAAWKIKGVMQPTHYIEYKHMIIKQMKPPHMHRPCMLVFACTCGHVCAHVCACVCLCI